MTMHRAAALAGSALVVLSLAACQKPKGDADSKGAAETARIAEEGFVYGLPLVMDYGTINEFFLDKTSSQYKGPIDVLKNEDRVFTPADTGVVTPNSDTPYSFVLMDLRAEPRVLCAPQVAPNRYFSVQLIDLNTYNYGYMGSRTTGNGAACFMIAGPDWKGATPAGIKQVFHSPTQFSLALIRTQLFGPDDLKNVAAIQKGYSVKPLSAFAHTAPPPPPTPVSWPAFDGEASPAHGGADSAAAGPWPAFSKDKVKTEFFNYLAYAMQFIPPDPKEAQVRADLAKIGVAPGKPFDLSKLSEAQKAGLMLGMKAGMDKVDAAAKTLGEKVNGWNVAKIDVSQQAINGDWLKRAAIAKAGIYANNADEALYPMTRSDGAGGELDGTKHSYTITFAKDALPPVNAFWSVTMYDGKTQLLVNNPIKRYLINSPMLSAMKRNPDGSLTLYISKTSPGPDKESNWLPAPDGPIYLAMRLYWPKAEALNGTWKPPAVTVAS